MQDGLKGGITAALEDLKDVLGEAEYQSDMRRAVSATVSLVHLLVNTANRYGEIAAEMKKNDAIAPLASAVIDGVYYYRAQSMKFSTIEQVRSAKRDFAETIGAKVEAHTAAFRNAFTASQENGLYEALHAAANGLDLALTASQTDAENTVYAALSSFKSELLNIAQHVNSGYYQDGAIQSELDGAFSKSARTLTDGLMPETYNLIMDEFVRLRLAQIFGISESTLPPVGEGSSQGGNQSGGNTGNEPGGAEDDDKTAEGGYSSEKIKYGSDDVIYDHDRGELVLYGEYLNIYRARVEGQIKELIEKGEYSEELDEIINAYFEILRGGIKEEENNQ